MSHGDQHKIRTVLSDVAALIHEYNALPAVNCATGTRRFKRVVIGKDPKSASRILHGSDISYQKPITLTVERAGEAACQ